MDPSISVQNQNFTRNPEKLAKVPGTQEETKSHLHWQFLGIWQSLWDPSWNHWTSAPNRLETTGIAESSAQSKGRHLCCIVAIRSEWKLVGRFYGMLHLCAKRHRFNVWWEDVLWKTFWATYLLKDRLFHLVQWLSITLQLRRTSQESINLDKILPWLFLGYALYARRIWKGSGGDQDLRRSTLVREREGSLPKPQDSLLDAGEAINDFWSTSGSFMYRHHVELRVKLYSPREESFPCSTEIHKLGCYARNVALIFSGTSMGQEICQIHGQVSLITLLEENLQKDECGSRWRLTRQQLTCRPVHLWPEPWEKLVRNVELKERQKWSHEKPKLDNAIKLRGICFSDPKRPGSQGNHAECS